MANNTDQQGGRRMMNYDVFESMTRFELEMLVRVLNEIIQEKRYYEGEE